MSHAPADGLARLGSPELLALETACGLSAPPAPEHRHATTLHAVDGTALTGHWWLPRQRTPAAVAVVNAATGVAARFYGPFAAWLAERGYAVLTYDYRGIGASRRGPVRAEAATMRDWALLDMGAALAAARQRAVGPALAAGRVPLLVVGHSFGGNAAGLARGIEHADALLLVAAQAGDWRLWPAPHRWVTWAWFHAVLPAAAAAFGHAPAWLLGGRGEPLPGAVAAEWARWGRRRGFLFTDETLGDARRGFAQYRGHAHLWHVADDLTFGPPRAVDALAARFEGAAVQRHGMHPADVGQRRLGHFGVFRRQAGPRAWQRLLAPLEAALPALPRA